MKASTMTTATDMQTQAAANVREYRQTSHATAFPLGGTREVIVQTLDVEQARKIVENRP